MHYLLAEMLCSGFGTPESGMAREATVAFSHISLLRQDVAGPLLDGTIRSRPWAFVRGVCSNLLAILVHMELLHASPLC